MTGTGWAADDDALSLDVISVNYHSAEEMCRLARDLRGLAAHGVHHRLIVVDCSGELTGGGEQGLWAEVLDPGSNIGFGQACNIGLQCVESDITAFLNPDFSPDPEGFARMARLGRAESAIGWSGVLRNADGTIQRNTAPVFTLWRLALEYLLGIDTSLPPSRLRREVRTISGAVLLVRTSDLRTLGGFDAGYPLYMEDVDLTDRLSRSGLVVQYPVEIGVHVGGRSSAQAPRATTTMLHASRIRWFAGQGRVGGILARTIVVGGCCIRWLLLPAKRARLSPLAIWRAGGRSFALATLLPVRQTSS